MYQFLLFFILLYNQTSYKIQRDVPSDIDIEIISHEITQIN